MASSAIPHFVALGAGALTIAAGAFVLAARPQHPLHRLFFLLAIADGASTILFRLSYLSLDAATASYFRATYWYFFLAFIVLTVVFGVTFPLARGHERTTRLAIAGALGVGLAAVAAYVVDRTLFWTMAGTTTARAFPNGPLGNLTTAVFVGSLALLALLLTRDLHRSHSASHRRQSALIMGGMTLAYAPYATGSLVQGALLDPARAFVTGPFHSILAYWTFVAYVAVLVVSAMRLLRIRDSDRVHDARFVLACYVGVALFTTPALAWPTHDVLASIRAVAFVCYPILLGYAILRFEVFDIDRQVRRAATITLVVGALAIVFILAQNALENALQERLFGGIPSQLLSGALAAVVVTVASVPIAKVSRRAASRIVPELSQDALHHRKLEVYRHGLAGALADGLIEERESRTLKALQESLGITPQEHETILAEVRASAAAG